MVSIVPAKKKSQRRKRKRAAVAAPPAPLTLVSAYYDGDVPGVYLTFDRAVDASAAVVGAFTVNDGPDSIHFVGTGAVMVVSDTQIRITLANVGSYGGDDVLLDVGADSGIVAVDDGGTWAGVADVVLPFG